MRQIQKLYRKEKNRFKEEKKYVVNKNFSTVGSKSAPRGVKLVDKRLKKDQRKQKHMSKRGGGGRSKSSGKGGKGGKGKGGKGGKGKGRK